MIWELCLKIQGKAQSGQGHSMKPKILVSACLIGQPVRYDGKDKNKVSEISELKEKYDIIPICPEVMGGLPIPRPQSEIKGDKVINILGKDVTENFKKGAEKALELAKENKVLFALLKQSSPSCGTKTIYNGNFEKVKIEGMGVTAKLLSENGITVYCEEDIKDILNGNTINLKKY